MFFSAFHMLAVVSYHPDTAKHFYFYSKKYKSSIRIIHTFPRLPRFSGGISGNKQICFSIFYYLQVVLTKSGLGALNELSYFVLPPLFELIAIFFIPSCASAVVVRDPVTPLVKWRARSIGAKLILSTGTPCKSTENKITQKALLDSHSRGYISKKIPRAELGLSPLALVIGDKYYAGKSDLILCMSSFSESTYLELFSAVKSAVYLPLSVADAQNKFTRPSFVLDPRSSREKALRILMAGHWTVRKGFYSALSALEICSNDYDLELIHIGLCNDNNLRKRYSNFPLKFVLLGHKSHAQVIEIMRSCDVLLHPAYSEGAANVIVEAMRNALPVICSKNCIGPDLIVDKQTGFILPDNDLKSIIGAVSSVAQDRVSLAGVAKRAFEYANSELNEEMLASSLAKSMHSIGIVHRKIPAN